jgi:hypothetical protein
MGINNILWCYGSCSCSAAPVVLIQVKLLELWVACVDMKSVSFPEYTIDYACTDARALLDLICVRTQNLCRKALLTAVRPSNAQVALAGVWFCFSTPYCLGNPNSTVRLPYTCLQ